MEKLVEKYVKITAKCPALDANPKDTRKFDLHVKLGRETISIFTDISNTEKYKNDSKHVWSIIKSVEEKSTMVFLFHFEDQTNAEINTIFNLGFINIDDEYDLRSIAHNRIFLINLICQDSNPTNSYYIFSVTFVFNQEKYASKYQYFYPEATDKTILSKNYGDSNRMLENINDRITVNVIDISELQEKMFSYRISIYVQYLRSNIIYNAIESEIKIDILQQKYYYYNFSIKHLDIFLIIHCEIHKIQNEFLRSRCDAKDNKTFCDINDKEICLNPKMGGPPNCQNRSNYGIHFCANGAKMTHAQNPLSPNFNIECQCLEHYNGINCIFHKPCPPCDINCPKLIKNNFGYSSNCSKREWCRNGTLLHNENFFHCQCLKGYYGKFCEIDLKMFCGIYKPVEFLRGNLICENSSNKSEGTTKLILLLTIIIGLLIIIASLTLLNNFRKNKRKKMGEININFDEINEFMKLKKEYNINEY